MKNMRLYIILLATLLLGAEAVAAQTKQPSIKFDFVAKDYGAVAQGEPIKQTFLFTNDGIGVLRILNIGTH
jgi:hypothetical protein